MEDNKNILNMKLEDEPFLNKKTNFGQNLIGLHNRGIYTLRDFINMDLKTVPNTATRNEFFRLIDILKYKYLGEALVCDVLLYKKYPVTYQEYLNLKEEYHYHCVGEEWLMRDILQVLKRDCIKLGIPFKEVIYRRLFRPNGEKSTLTMEEYLGEIGIKDSRIKYLVDFYLEYISNKKSEKATTLDELESLKMQLSSLTSERDDLDKQIEDVKVQIQIMREGKGKNNARK